MRLRVHVPGSRAPHLPGVRIVSQDDPVFCLRRNREGTDVRAVEHATNRTRPETPGEACRCPMALHTTGGRASFLECVAGDGAAPPAASWREPICLLLATQFHGRGAP